MDDMSFETSSHATLDYLLEKEMTKSFTFGFGRRYMHHLKMPRPKKRTLSAASFNWNLLVDRIDGRLELEAQENAKLNSGTPMVKLTEILGADLLTRIKNELPELYEQLMEHISNKQMENEMLSRNRISFAIKFSTHSKDVSISIKDGRESHN